MNSFFLFVTSRLPLVFGVLGVWFAVERWFVFHTLPRYAPARFCGNCFLAFVGVPTELGLLGLLVAAFSLLEIPYCGRNVIYWCCAAVGVLFTPVGIGIPLFAFAFLMLMLPITSALFKGAIRVAFRL
jgi:hypothetical protein